MECPKCRNRNAEDSKFCIKCGTSLTEKLSRSELEDVLFTPESKKSTLFRNLLIGVVGVIIILVLLASINPDYSNEETVPDETATESEEEITDESTSFTSIEHSFKIDFPTYPETERIPEETIEGLTYRGIQYVAEDEEGSAYLAQVAEYDIDPSEYDNQIGMEGAINFMFKDGENILDRSYFTTFNGYDAVEFSFTNIVEDFQGKGIAFVQDDLTKVKMFILLSTSFGDPAMNFSAFKDSFAFAY